MTKRLSLKQLHERIKESVDDAATKWSDLNVLQDQIHKHLSNHVDGVIGALLGLKRDRWDNTSWEVIRHHPELINGSSALAEKLDAFVKEQCLKWIAEIIENPPQPTKSQISALKKFYLERYIGELESHIKRLAYKQAMENAQALVEKELALGPIDDPFNLG